MPAPTTAGGSQLPEIVFPGNPMPSSGFNTYLHTCSAHTYTQVHIIEEETFKMDFMYLFVKVACMGGETFSSITLVK